MTDARLLLTERLSNDMRLRSEWLDAGSIASATAANSPQSPPSVVDQIGTLQQTHVFKDLHARSISLHMAVENLSLGMLLETRGLGQMEGNFDAGRPTPALAGALRSGSSSVMRIAGEEMH